MRQGDAFEGVALSPGLAAQLNPPAGQGFLRMGSNAVEFVDVERACVIISGGRSGLGLATFHFFFPKRSVSLTGLEASQPWSRTVQPPRCPMS